MSLLAGVGAFSQVAGGITDKLMLDKESDALKVQADLQSRAIRKSNRQATGSYISDVGASGVELTLDQIADRTKEAELDVAIAQDFASRQKDINTTAGYGAILEGVGGAAMTLDGAGMLNKKPAGIKATSPFEFSSMWGGKDPLKKDPIYGPFTGIM